MDASAGVVKSARASVGSLGTTARNSELITKLFREGFTATITSI